MISSVNNNKKHDFFQNERDRMKAEQENRVDKHLLP